MVRRTMTQIEFLRRFEKLEESDRTTPEFILSADATLGVPRLSDSESRFFSFGRLKIKKRVKRGALMLTNTIWVDVGRVYRAMRILRRRKRVELGLFQLDRALLPATRDGEHIIVIAPLYHTDWTQKEAIPLEDFVERYPEKRIRELETWIRILGFEYGQEK